MKGTILNCLEELVTRKFGAAQWRSTLRMAGQPDSRIYGTFEDVPENEVHVLLNAVSATVNLTLQEVMELFGDYWSTVYAPRVYAAYFVGSRNAREFLLNLDNVHTALTRSQKSARPPRFRYEWHGNNHLIMHYESSRGLVALMGGLVRGVGKHFGESLTVTILGNAVHVQFP